MMVTLLPAAGIAEEGSWAIHNIAASEGDEHRVRLGQAGACEALVALLDAHIESVRDIFHTHSHHSHSLNSHSLTLSHTHSHTLTLTHLIRGIH